MNLEVLVEERSAEQVLRVMLPRIVADVEFDVWVFQGKPDLLRKLPDRLKGYAPWIGSADTCLVVLVDRDDEDCLSLKARLEQMVADAGLSTISSASTARRVDVVNRIAVEELEAWFFGDVPTLCAAYPPVPSSLGNQAKYRDPDGIRGSTWEALERVLQECGYHWGGLAKVVAATEIAQYMNVDINRSRSFRVFRDGVRQLVVGGSCAEKD